MAWPRAMPRKLCLADLPEPAFLLATCWRLCQQLGRKALTIAGTEQLA